MKRVINDPAKTKEVVEWYLDTHPFSSDTTTIYVQGQTQLSIDTIVHTDTILKTDQIIKEIRVTKLIRDTIVKTIRDNALIQAMQQTNLTTQTENNLLKDQIKTIGKQADKWQYRFMGLLFLVGLGASLRILKAVRIL